MKEPIISGYPIHANLTSILPKHPSFRNWINTNYIQLRFDSYQEQNNYFLEFYQPLMRNHHPLLNIHSIQKKMLFQSKIDIVDFLISSINSGNYVYVLIDQKYIEAYQRTESKLHDLFIYGYDLDKRVFYTADFFQDPLPVYKHSAANFIELEKAITNYFDKNGDPWDDVFGIQFININQYKTYKFSLNDIIRTIKDYVNSHNTAKDNEFIEGIPPQMMEFNGSPDPKFGMGIYDKLAEYADFDYYFLRASHILYEHKKLMKGRIDFIHELALIDGNSLIENFVEIERKALIIRNFILMQMINKDNSKKTKLKSMLRELETIEYNILDKLLQRLK